ncbi:MAG: type II toxin-antitoxin system RelE/ParE family toxin [Verrucomicrobiaceae bacterium]|nr:MAG: type II toxin-antitoxin system RelE/ParE family toxin [Verrucomicrobiaceae bacterium]
MSWLVEFRPEVHEDVTVTAAWYESRESGLGGEFVEEIIAVWEGLAVDPSIGARKSLSSGVRWKYPDRFPYRVLYSVDENLRTIIIIAVLHAARHDSRWQKRIP